MQQFVVGPELQQFLASLPSASLTNVVWDASVQTDIAALPFNPSAVRRMLAFSKAGYTDEATPVYEYNAWLQSLDLTYLAEISFSRTL